MKESDTFMENGGAGSNAGTTRKQEGTVGDGLSGEAVPGRAAVGAGGAVRTKILPLALTAVVFLLDQLTKLLVVQNIPAYTIGSSFFGDFLRIIHVYNPGIAFSMGNSLPDAARGILFAVAPLIVLAVVLVVYFRNDEFTPFQRWAVAGIVGGGLGNIYDRFFRPEGVVDFIDVKFYGLFGLERWPTFNVADAAVLICGFLLIISFIRAMRREGKAQKAGDSQQG